MFGFRVSSPLFGDWKSGADRFDGRTGCRICLLDTADAVLGGVKFDGGGGAVGEWGREVGVIWGIWVIEGVVLLSVVVARLSWIISIESVIEFKSLNLY